MEILNLEMEIDGNKDDSKEKNALKKEIEEYEKLLKRIIVKIKKLDRIRWTLHKQKKIYFKK